nr:MAG TPA: hypothetical protein [Caudoviricetes sp.]
MLVLILQDKASLINESSLREKAIQGESSSIVRDSSLDKSSIASIPSYSIPLSS